MAQVYRKWLYCFQPIHIYEAGSGKPVAFLLRPGKRPSGAEAVKVLRHVIRRIHANWPRTAITVRGDGHYGTPEVMDVNPGDKLVHGSGQIF